MSDFPLYCNYYKASKKHFRELVKKFDPVLINYIPQQMRYRNFMVKYLNSYILIKEDWDKNEELNNMTDCFSESVRIKCRFKNYPTPLEYWEKNRDRIMSKVNDKNNIKQIRDALFESTKLCNNFRISIAYTIFGMFGAKRILDPTAGWGDRLCAAIANDSELYVGIDTNTDLFPCYTKMIKKLCSKEKRKNYIMINDGIETAKLPVNDFDLVFTSPPFFDLEEYSKSSKDSMVAHPTADRWYNDFLLVLLKKAYDHLIVGGRLVLYVAESTDTSYIKRMEKYMSQLMKYEGSIYYYYETTYKPRQIYVWRK